MRKVFNWFLFFGLLMMILLMLAACGSGDSSETDGDDSTDGDTDSADGDLDGDITDGDDSISCPPGFHWNDDKQMCQPGEEPTDGDVDEEAEGPFPAVVCKTPEPLDDGPYFTDVTDKVGIGVDGLAVTGNRLAAVDIDDDGYPDLVVHAVSSNKRDDLEADPPLFLKRVLLNRPNPNKEGGRIFIDVTEESGYAEIRGGGFGRASHFAVFGDVNNDGYVDAFSGTYVDRNNPDTDPGDRSEILLGTGEGHFSLADSSDTTPAAENLWSTTGATFVDVNRDGNLDVWVGFWYEQYGYLAGLQNRLYMGAGDGSFTDVTDEWGLTTTYRGWEDGTNHKPTYGITACDVDDDGNMDLVASSYGRQFNELWRNTGEGFEDISQSSGFACDEDKDYSDNQFYACYCTLHECDPDPGPPRVVCPSPADAYWSSSDTLDYRLGGNTFTTICGDFTGDGLPDLHNSEIVHWHIGGSSDPSQLLVNETTADGVHFARPGRMATGLDRMHLSPDWNEGDITAVRLDFDNDGYPDLYQGSSDYPYTFSLLFRQLRDGFFKDISKDSGCKHERGNGVTVADFDRDGDLDIFVGSSLARESPWDTAEVHLYRNDVGQDANSVRITLIGKGAGYANTSAIGARVKIKTGDRTQTEWIEGGYGHFGIQQDLSLTVGLGESCVMDELSVRWPNSELTEQVWADVPANYHIIIEEGSEPIFEPIVGGTETD